jgi:hypothetical protein
MEKKDLSKTVCTACLVTWMACLKCRNPNCLQAQGYKDSDERNVCRKEN